MHSPNRLLGGAFHRDAFIGRNTKRDHIGVDFCARLACKQRLQRPNASFHAPAEDTAMLRWGGRSDRRSSGRILAASEHHLFFVPVRQHVCVPAFALSAEGENAGNIEGEGHDQVGKTVCEGECNGLVLRGEARSPLTGLSGQLGIHVRLSGWPLTDYAG